MDEATATAPHLGVGGQYLTFQLGAEVYGLQILTVQEIIGMTKVTHIPRTPDSIRGVINLRGKVIPVMDLRARFNMEEQDPTERTCIIVMQTESAQGAVTTGVIVDEVSEVVDIPDADIEPTPSFGADIRVDFLLGMSKTDGKVVSLLDINRVLSDHEIASINALSIESQPTDQSE